MSSDQLNPQNYRNVLHQDRDFETQLDFENLASK